MPVPLSLIKLLNRLKYFFASLFSLTFIFIGILVIDQKFKIKDIQITGVEKNELVVGLSDLYNRNIILLNPSIIKDSLIKNNSYIKSVEVRKHLPNTISIIIEKDKPIASLKTSDGYFVLSSSGRIIKKNKNDLQNYPTINFYQQLNYLSYQAGHRIDFIEIKLVLKMIDLMNNIGLKMISIDIRQRDMILFNLDNQQIIITTEKSYELQEYQLTTIVKQYRVEGKDYQSIDLRFDKPIIKH